MTSKKKFWLIYPILLLFLVSCNTASAKILNEITPTITSTKGETNLVPLIIASDIPTQELPDKPSPSPKPILTEVDEEISDYRCDDPFDGINIRFSPNSWETNFCNHSVPLDEFLSGGPPRDGIPPIDNPEFESVESADGWLEDQEPVIVVESLGESRAYPLQILIWHEIVNDTIGGKPIVVTFCPLCNTGLVFERPLIDGEVLTFGTSGNLRNSDLVMWDRQTESWWQQFTGEALVGDLTGKKLKIIPTSIISWSDHKTRYPESQVLSIETGYIRNYGVNPYPGYDNVDQYPFLFDGLLDDRLLPMTRVLGIDYLGVSTAYNMERLKQDRVINDMLGEVPIVVEWKSGTASALDSSLIAQGRDVGSSHVFLRSLDELVLTFSANSDGTFKDIETGSIWDSFGVAIDGPLMGKKLQAIAHHETFWFAWAAFVPDGSLVN